MLIKVLVFAFFPVALILLQPDLGTALVFIFFIAVMIFVSGIDRKYIIFVIALALIMLVIGLISFYFIMKDYTPNEDYRIDRIVTFFYPELDPEDTGYQVIQSKTAI
ncbi:MAG: cell division protein RodA, partial [Sedimentibacter sp.]|nr:cell division protein RodA [Sedimentibacter sp.]